MNFRTIQKWFSKHKEIQNIVDTNFLKYCQNLQIITLICSYCLWHPQQNLNVSRLTSPRVFRFQNAIGTSWYWLMRLVWSQNYLFFHNSVDSKKLKAIVMWYLTATGSTATMNEAKTRACTNPRFSDPIAPTIDKPYRAGPKDKNSFIKETEITLAGNSRFFLRFVNLCTFFWITNDEKVHQGSHHSIQEDRSKVIEEDSVIQTVCRIQYNSAKFNKKSSVMK